MASYVLKEHVPILDEHELKKEGKVIERLDKSKLEEIARLANRRVKETGDVVPLVIGHTRDDEDEVRQPPIVGYAKNFTVGPLKKTGRYAIHADFYFKKDKVHLAKDYPRRSVELWLDEWKIDPISLLGASTPARDLGVLRMSRGQDGGKVFRYSHVFGSSKVRLKLEKDDDVEDEGDDDAGEEKSKPVAKPKPKGEESKPSKPSEKGNSMGDDNIVDEVLRKLMQTSVWQKLEQMVGADKPEMPGEMGGLDDPLGDDMGLGGDMGLDPLGDDLDPGLDPLGDFGDGYVEEDEVDDKLALNKGGFPASGNTDIERMSKKERQRVSDDSNRIKLAKLTSEVQKLKEQNVKFRMKLARAERERDLTQLEAEGYELDKAEELDDSMSMNDAQWKNHLQRIRKRYSKAPTGYTDGYLAVDHSVGRGNPSVEQVKGRDEVDQILKFAEENDIDDFDKAKRMLFSKGKTA